MKPFAFLWNKIADEPVVTFAIAYAAVNAATDHTWQGYVAAVAVALLRFAVSPATKRV